jgi:predicted branched-subunit amino acid permease
MSTPPFKPGFRIDAVDSVVLVAGAIGSVAAAQVEWWMGLVIAFTVGHFFLFCNVFRMARPLELAWTALFIALAVSTITTEKPGWQITIAVSLLATVVIIVVQMRRPSYHGVAWQRINPNLRKWWEAQSSEPEESEQ